MTKKEAETGFDDIKLNYYKKQLTFRNPIGSLTNSTILVNGIAEICNVKFVEIIKDEKGDVNKYEILIFIQLRSSSFQIIYNYEDFKKNWKA